MNAAIEQHSTYENVQSNANSVHHCLKRPEADDRAADPSAGNGLLANGHDTDSPQLPKLSKIQGNRHGHDSTLGLEDQLETVSVQHPSPIIIPQEIEAEPARKVHFYGRVRITSGVGHSGRSKSDWLKKEDSLEDGDAITHVDSMDVPPRRESSHQSTDSSASASYSSSISAPLRSSTELPPRAASSRFSGRRRKPLSNVLGSQEANSWLHALAEERHKRRNQRMARTMDETSPLLQADSPVRTRAMSQDTSPDGESGHKPDDDSLVEDDSPWRLFTLNYWESQLSALCCCETDSEE